MQNHSSLSETLRGLSATANNLSPTGFHLSWLDIGIVVLPLIAVFVLTGYMRKFMRSVADYLAANRCAGRYLICTAAAETHGSAVALVVALEVFSKAGFSLGPWNQFQIFIIFMLTLVGFVTYRFRETRSMTFHQFFENRYSKGVRVFASFLNFFSGLFTFGIAPLIAGKFIVYFTGLPLTTDLGIFQVETYTLIMLGMMAMAMVQALSGGHISVMMTDCLEGLISGAMYLVVAFAVLWLFSFDQMETAMLSGAPGKSFVDPLDIGSRADFDFVFVLINLAWAAYIFRGATWNAAFTASARSAHEGKMAGILSTWRGFASGVMVGICALGAFTVLHHPDFVAQQAQVAAEVARIGNPSEQSQMIMPTALGLLLPDGVKGALCSILVMGIIANLGNGLQSFGNTMVQDVILPLRRNKGPLKPEQHIRLLRRSSFCVGLFALAFSCVYRPADYLQMLMMILGAIYLAGIGSVVLGGLYWSRGTAAGAWASLIAGSSIAISASVLQQVWPDIQPWAVQVTSGSGLSEWFAAHPKKFPLNGQILSAIAMGVAGSLYVIVSLLTCRKPHDMDKLLHRGAYAVAGEAVKQAETRSRWSPARFLGWDENYTRGDRLISGGIFVFKITMIATVLVAMAWNFLIARWTPEDWWHYGLVINILLPLFIGIGTTIWFTIGGIIDMKRAFIDLENAKRDANDDGQVHEH